MNIRRIRSSANRSATRRIACALTTLLLPLVVGLAPARADLITFFDFNSSPTASSGGPRTSTITNNFGPGSLSRTMTGTDVNADPDGAAGPQPPSPAGSGLELFNVDSSANSNQGRFIQFGVDTTGFQNIIVNFATEDPSGIGFNNNSFQYSTDGTTFTAFGTAYDPPDSNTAAGYGLQTFDLSGVSSVSNNPNTAFRIVFGGGSTTDFNASNRIDNIAINGQSQVVVPAPEPSTWVMMIIGLASLAITMRKKKDSPRA